MWGGISMSFLKRCKNKKVKMKKQKSLSSSTKCEYLLFNILYLLLLLEKEEI
jgi:hypothetical protein